MNRIETAAVFLLILVIYLIVGSALMYRAGYVTGEVNIRSGMAADLVDGNERGRQGLVCSVFWAPLPTLLILPFAFSKALLDSGFACVIISAAGGALACLFMFKALRRFSVPRMALYPMIALAAFNPWMLLVSSTGSSEALLLGFLCAALWSFVLWHYDGRLSGLVGLSIMAALLPLVKHQAILFSVLIVGLATAISVARGKPRLRRTEGTLLLAAFPTVYMIGLWFLFNWLIMGDAVFFLRGAYIDPILSEPTTEMAGIQGMLSGTSLSPVSMRTVSPFFAQFLIVPFSAVALVLLAVCLVRARNWPVVLFVCLLVAMPVYHVLMARHGQSFDITGDMSVAIPICIFIAGYFLYSTFGRKRAAMGAGSAVVLLLLAGGTVGSYYCANENLVPTPFVRTASFPYVAPRKQGNEGKILEYIRSKEGLDSRIALMGFQGYDFIRRVNGGEEFVHLINVDIPLIDFRTKGKTLWMLVPKPSGLGAFDSVNLAYRGLYEAKQRDIFTGDVRFNLLLDNREFPEYHIIAVTREQEDRDIFLEKAPKEGGEFLESASSDTGGDTGS